jgi:hypothetical protein
MDTNEHESGTDRKFEEMLEIIGVLSGNAAGGDWKFPVGATDGCGAERMRMFAEAFETLLSRG